MQQPDKQIDHLDFTCAGMKDGQKFPLEHTGRGKDLSPEFTMENLLPQAKFLLILLEDMSHPIKNFTHWLIWNIPATDKISAAIAPGKVTRNGAMQGMGYGMHRYAGPKPPKGKSHTYRFSVYALDSRLHISAYATKKKVLSKAEDHIIQKGSMYGYFE